MRFACYPPRLLSRPPSPPPLWFPLTRCSTRPSLGCTSTQPSPVNATCTGLARAHADEALQARVRSSRGAHALRPDDRRLRFAETSARRPSRAGAEGRPRPTATVPPARQLDVEQPAGENARRAFHFLMSQSTPASKASTLRPLQVIASSFQLEAGEPPRPAARGTPRRCRTPSSVDTLAGRHLLIRRSCRCLRARSARRPGRPPSIRVAPGSSPPRAAPWSRRLVLKRERVL